MTWIVFRSLHMYSPHAWKKKKKVQLSAMIGPIRHLQDLGPWNNKLMVLTGALLAVNTNTTILDKS